MGQLLHNIFVFLSEVLIKGDAVFDSILLKSKNCIRTPILLKLDSSGNAIWGHAFDFTGSQNSRTYGISFDDSCNIGK
jgi:hypothetical protein